MENRFFQAGIASQVYREPLRTGVFCKPDAAEMLVAGHVDALTFIIEIPFQYHPFAYILPVQGELPAVPGIVRGYAELHGGFPPGNKVQAEPVHAFPCLPSIAR